jgi:hypothetical protein
MDCFYSYFLKIYEQGVTFIHPRGHNQARVNLASFFGVVL